MSEDELRPITALFADITGSTALGERLAPEEVKALIGECVSRMSRAVEEFGGMIQAYQGDGICAYFGVPTAHEDDPERAARAAMRIVAVMADYAREAEDAWGVTGLNVRVGLNSGSAAVGSVGAAVPGTVALGDTTNIAARLESNAAPGTIIVGDMTARRLAGRFTVEPLGQLAVKGRAEPVSAWRLTGEIAEAAADDGRPLFGREREAATLGAALTELAEGRGAVVLIQGDAGIGKTRMLGAMRQMSTGTVTWLDGHGRSYGGRPLAAIADLVRGWLEEPAATSDLMIRTRLRARLGDDDDDLMPTLSRVLGIQRGPGAADALVRRTPAEVATAVRAGVHAWARSVTDSRPLVVAVDDAHWIDEASADVVEALLTLTDRAPLMVVLALRPETDSLGWRLRARAMNEYSHRLHLTELGPLPDDAAGALAEYLAAGGVDEATRRELVAMSEGNPLYLEELLASLIETGALERGRTWTLTVPVATILPPALEGLLVARIDRLPDDVRGVAQAAGIIGRAFPRSLLAAIVPGDLDGALADLLRARIVVEHGRVPEATYEFRHGMLQQAATATLTKAHRSELHLAVARAIEQQDPEHVADRAEELAHHFGQGQDLARALHYLEIGAERAISVGATEQAGRLWFRALRAANRIPDAAAAERIRGRLGGVQPG